MSSSLSDARQLARDVAKLTKVPGSLDAAGPGDALRGVNARLHGRACRRVGLDRHPLLGGGGRHGGRAFPRTDPGPGGRGPVERHTVASREGGRAAALLACVVALLLDWSRRSELKRIMSGNCASCGESFSRKN